MGQHLILLQVRKKFFKAEKKSVSIINQFSSCMKYKTILRSVKRRVVVVAVVVVVWPMCGTMKAWARLDSSKAKSSNSTRISEEVQESLRFNFHENFKNNKFEFNFAFMYSCIRTRTPPTYLSLFKISTSRFYSLIQNYF